MNNPESNGGDQPGWQQPPQQQFQQQGHEGHGRSQRFFGWIRRSGFVRSGDRWIGGVCQGLADRFGVSVLLVRALTLAALVVGGLGLSFYAVAWFLLPDARDGSIMAEDLFRGIWRNVYLGPFLFWLMSFGMPGVGLFLALLTFGLLMLMINSLVSAPAGNSAGYYPGGPSAGGSGYGPCGFGGPGYGGPGKGPNSPGYGGPAGSAASFQGPAGSGPSSWTSPSSQDHPGPGPEPVTPPAAATGPAAPRGPVPSGQAADLGQGQAYSAGGAYGGVAAIHGPAAFYGSGPYRPSATGPATYAAPNSASPIASVPPSTKPRLARRKPAGPALVMSSIGLILLSLGVAFLLMPGRHMQLGTLLQVGLIWASVVCGLLGLLIVILGLAGRRTGGLIPLVSIMLVVLLVFLCGTVPYSVIYHQMTETSSSYEAIAADRKTVIRSGAKDMRRLQRGLALSSSEYDKGDFVIDLTDYAKGRQPHEHKSQSGKVTQSTCPTGTINLTAYRTQVTMILPDHCTYGFNSWQEFDYPYTNTIGGRLEATGQSGYEYLGNNRKDEGQQGGPDLVINASYLVEAKLHVRYQSADHAGDHHFDLDDLLDLEDDGDGGDQDE
ncbi:hypothetical protein CRD60_05795 [Bifidobacterium aemilianum]|uniref:Phage shock protein PspC N-terminal domain-containing protein n=1 Tax=Bifidobacterium aemilianum TaxID=2493120 RepID=A0A366KA21_9BIFI|nr:PspC domain-containing protein [Bifidobacterium aemilianum]RBP97511.1 hypothetical protein CRD60_05795 [Bifidobacterium aemilianum]